MTSSLVGSEMCIRDRVKVADEMPDPPDGVLRLVRAVGVQSKLGSLCAVSYTHLTLPTICSV
eukprot:4431283-Prorocentrum_lima.AAC.1